ncbi:MAG: hypoxanthine phosphoribosyltransferase [Chthoniobacteraceae bacterium]|nr:hypoxanthine phosphoribosyltransferase [Chthoniobacteraceae bacterium]
MNRPPFPAAPGRVLFSAGVIAARLDTLAAELTAFYREKPLTVLPILNGSLPFAADLLRRIPLPLHLECLSVASYHGAAQSSGTVTFRQHTLPPVADRDVLLLDDILDTGRTLHAVRQRLLAEAAPRSVRVAVLLRKNKLRAEPMEADYAGFDIADEFVIGYGLDYEGRYRNLPELRVITPPC